MEDGTATANPPPALFTSRLSAALTRAVNELLAARTPDGHWEGQLSASALSTATAVTALAIVQREAPVTDHQSPITSGLAWLSQHTNADGGWGDTVLSVSNISTTTLCWAAFGAVPGADEKYRDVVQRAESWLSEHAGGLSSGQLAAAIVRRYGKDRTFSAPILTMCALAGRLGSGNEAWRYVLQLPFELAACPPAWFAALRLPVVSYALPALIAIGQARHFHRPTRNPVSRLLRRLTHNGTLRVLTRIQPASGGFLEATPLTSFVVMSLAGSGQAGHPVTRKGAEFLLKSQRADGCWPIDTNLATWATTLSVNALAPCGTTGPRHSTLDSRPQILDWLLNQQHRVPHPYTNAAPGGWAWTDLPGGVPDADDTAGALLALHHLGRDDFHVVPELKNAVVSGITWLLDLQNRDGGIPTFCRGWGTLPFDRSAPDLTAHAMRAWLSWREEMPMDLQRRMEAALNRAIDFLARTQRADGSWIPLWFGNQSAPDDENPTYGTARVLRALTEARNAVAAGFSLRMNRNDSTAHRLDDLMNKGTRWLLSAQNPDGSWGGFRRGAASVEETALAVEALAEIDPRMTRMDANERQSWEAAVLRGADWLIERVESGEWRKPAPIGFYFARLWYYEELYPLIFTVGALRSVTNFGSIPAR